MLRPCYQGKRLISGACVDCSRKLPDVCISIIAKTPAHPPIKDAAIIHHTEIIRLPRFFVVAVAGNRPWRRRSIQSVPPQAHRLLADRHSYVCYPTIFPLAAFDSSRYPADSRSATLNWSVVARAAAGLLAYIIYKADGLTDLPSEGAFALTRPEQDVRRRCTTKAVEQRSGRCRLALHRRLRIEATR